MVWHLKFLRLEFMLHEWSMVGLASIRICRYEMVPFFDSFFRLFCSTLLFSVAMLLAK